MNSKTSSFQEELGKALLALSQARDQDKKPVTVNFTGQGERHIRLGYLLFRLRVVDLQGQRPGLVRLTLRMLLGGGLSPFLDLVYLTSDTSRQSLRDKMGGTKRAVVAGRGRVGLRESVLYEHGLGLSGSETSPLIEKRNLR